jgi:hypothetical protein
MDHFRLFKPNEWPKLVSELVPFLIFHGLAVFHRYPVRNLEFPSTSAEPITQPKLLQSSFLLGHTRNDDAVILLSEV